MNELQVFNFNNKQVRVEERNNETWFCLKDVCSILDIKNHKDVVSRLKKDGVDTTDLIDRLGRTQQVTIINESNLYKVIFQSRKEEAEEFTEYVTGTILDVYKRQLINH